jgi:hypothetical protein
MGHPCRGDLQLETEFPVDHIRTGLGPSCFQRRLMYRSCASRSLQQAVEQYGSVPLQGTLARLAHPRAKQRATLKTVQPSLQARIPCWSLAKLPAAGEHTACSGGQTSGRPQHGTYSLFQL